MNTSFKIRKVSRLKWPILAAAQNTLRNVESKADWNVFTDRLPLGNIEAAARAVDVKLMSTPHARNSVIDGWLVGIKDNICTTDLQTSCASEMLRGYVSPYDATVVKLLRRAGGIIMGKTNMDEFGMGSYSTFSIYGPVHKAGPNKIGPDSPSGISAGGSSGGSAVAVASGMCDVTLGTDTGGSVRLPASYCGVIGFKPSYGLLSRWGVVAYANSLDTVGILARNTDEARSVFALLSKHDPMDPTSISAKTRQRVKENILGIEPVRINRPLRIGFPHEYNVEELSPLVRQAWLHTLQGLAEQGHEIVPLSLPNTKPALGAYYILASAEASSNLARYDGLRYGHRSSHDRSLKGDILYAPTREMGFGDEVRRRILLGTYALSSEAVGNYFQQAQRVRRLVQQDFDAAFLLPNFLRVNTKERKTKHYLNHGGVDAIIAPTALGIAPKINDVACAREVDALAGDVLTVPASLAGIPSISVPVSLAAADDYEGGTVGIQVMTQWGDESMMFRVAQKVQKLGGIRRGLGLYPIGINESKFKVLFPEDERRKDLKSSSVIPSETKPLESELKDEPSEVGPKDPSQSV